MDYQSVKNYCDETNAKLELQAHLAFANFLQQVEQDASYNRIPAMPNIPYAQVPVNNTPDQNPMGWENQESSMYVIENPFKFFLDDNGYLCLTWPGLKHSIPPTHPTTPWGLVNQAQVGINKFSTTDLANMLQKQYNDTAAGRTSEVNSSPTQSGNKVKTSNKR